MNNTSTEEGLLRKYCYNKNMFDVKLDFIILPIILVITFSLLVIFQRGNNGEP